MAWGIILMGIKHCGKSTQGRMLGKDLGAPFYDTDTVIKKISGKSPREIFLEEGKDGFMEKEKEACFVIAQEIEEKQIKKVVIATGGGICNNQRALEILRPLGTFVFMDVSKETATKRILREIIYTKDKKMKNLPAYIERESPKTEEDVARIFGDFYDSRRKLYKSLCDITCPLDRGTPLENKTVILEALRNQNIMLK